MGFSCSFSCRPKGQSQVAPVLSGDARIMSEACIQKAFQERRSIVDRRSPRKTCWQSKEIVRAPSKDCIPSCALEGCKMRVVHW